MTILHFYKKLILCVLAMIIVSVELVAQEPKFRQLEVKEGLPSATIYHVMQDDLGFIWLSTEAGLTRFDGVRPVNFNMDDGLPDNEIFGLFQDSQRRIWTKNYNGKFAYVLDSEIYHADNTPFLEELEQNNWIANIYESVEGSLYFAMQRDGFTVLSKDNEVLKVTRSQLYIKLNEFAKKQQKNGLVAGLNSRLSVLGFYELKDGNIRVISNIGEFIYNTTNKTCEAIRIYSQELYRVTLVDETTLLAIDNQFENTLFKYNPTIGFSPLFKSSDIGSTAMVMPYFKDEKGKLWLGSLGNGLFVINDFENNPTIESHFLKEKSPSWIYKDKEGNYWISTLGDGVFMLPTNTVLTYTPASGLASQDLYAITGDKKGNIYVGTVNGTINIIKPDGKIDILKTNRNERGYNRINDIIVDDDGAVWSGSDLGLTVFGKNIDFDKQFIKVLSKDAKGNIYIGSSESMTKLSETKSPRTIWKSRTMAIFPEQEEFIWLGSNDGLHLYSGGEVVDINQENPNYQYRIADIDMTQDSVLCLCTSGNGIVLKYLDKIKRITNKDGLVSNSCKDIFIDQNNVIWAATNIGISRFTINRKELEINKTSLVSYTEADNLASNDVRGVYAHDGKVWAATSAGLSYFEEAQQKMQTIQPPIYISGIKIWEKDTAIHDVYTLPHDQNNIKIEYTGISLKSGNRIKYAYRMDGIDKDWVTSATNAAAFPILEPGTYTFYVKAINIDQEESAAPAVVKFIILKPWWATTWFILLSTALGIGLVSAIVYYIMRNSRQKSQMRRQIVESEQMALRAQMNPHFIFNALNSIQHFITMEDEISANYYLTRFSKLVRQVLENSKTSFIYLTEEIDTLKLYLELETLRFEGKFEYAIHLDESVNAYDVEIPSMIIQPFVENAIWHGLMPRRDEPKLDIRFSQNDIFLICEVEDNGIGRKAAAENNKNRTKEHKSTGIDNTVKRLTLLAHVKEKLVTITDLEKDGVATGTLVTIKIPLVHEEF